MLSILLATTLLACGEPDNNNPNTDGGSTDGGIEDGGTYDGGTPDGGTEDGGTDTGTEPVGGNCGGPEPPEDSLWECEGMGDGPPWSSAGPPEDLLNCLTDVGMEYWIEENGLSVWLVDNYDGQEYFCEWDGESYIED